MNRRTLLLAVLFIALGAGAWYAWNYKKNQSGTRNSPDMEFAVTNTDDIGKIFIADRGGLTATLVRKNGYWEYNGQYRARRSAMATLLETIQKVNVLNIPPKISEPSMIKDLASDGIKVEIYDRKGDRMKCYYVGGITNDEQGTILIMDGSEKPYVCHIPGFVGTLRIRYLLGDDAWRDRVIFEEKPEEIQSVSVEYPQSKSESFRLEKTGTGEYQVTPFFSTTTRATTSLRTGAVESYLLQFERRGAEAFETRNPGRDSITALVPFAIVTLKKMDGTEKYVRFWPIETGYDPLKGGNYVARYLTDYNKGEAFLLTQNLVFAPIFRGYSFFFEGKNAQPVRN
jgi:hypothetical protein